MGHFLHILGILAEIMVRYWQFTEVKPATRTVHTPLGVAVDVARMLFFDRQGTVDTKYTLYTTSAVTPKGACKVLVAGLTSVD